jgi:uncharacterized protein YdeI (YjbR/CyaY-like superfamily)
MAKGIKKSFNDYCPKSRSEWRQWLQKNHTQPDGVWLVLAKKESGLKLLSVAEAVEEALCFGWIDSVANKIDVNFFKLFISPRNSKSKWSRINKGRVKKLAKLGLLTPAGKKMIALAKKTGTWEALNEVDQLILPKDLKTALSKSKLASKFFDAFPPSTRRGILEWILNAKQPETRSKRIKETVDLAKKNIRANQYKPLKR